MLKKYQKRPLTSIFFCRQGRPELHSNRSPPLLTDREQAHATVDSMASLHPPDKDPQRIPHLAPGKADS